MVGGLIVSQFITFSITRPSIFTSKSSRRRSWITLPSSGRDIRGRLPAHPCRDTQPRTKDKMPRQQDRASVR